MLLGKAIGSLVATRKDPRLEGIRLLVIQPLDGDLRPAGRLFVAADTIGAGAGEVVFYARGGEAVLALPSHAGPSDATVVGIIDTRGNDEGQGEPC